MKAVNKVLDLIEAFLTSDGDLGISELAKLTGFNVSTTNRIAMTLVKRGYLKQSGRRGKYSLGMKFFAYIGSLKSRVKFRQLAMPFMVKLCQEANDSVDLLSIEGMYCISIEVVPTNNMLRAVPSEGASYALYSSSGGKAILASYTDRQLEEYQRSVSFEQHTPNTISNVNELKKHLLVVRREGVAFDYEERVLNVHSVAAAIKGADGNAVGAIAVVGPKSRLTRARMEELAPLVKKYALDVSREMGYRGQEETVTSTVISAILLAAGESKRMGQPKQLMLFNQSTIIEQAVDNLLNSAVSETIVVLGHRAKEVRKAVAGRQVKIAINPDYRQGMSTSVIAGLDLVDGTAGAVMLALADQPLIDSQTINSLIEAFAAHDKGIAVPVYRGRRGHPVIFDIGYKGELLGLRGDVGGRELIDRHPDDVLEVPVDCEGICIDIDTIDSYNLSFRGK